MKIIRLKIKLILILLIFIVIISNVIINCFIRFYFQKIPQDLRAIMGLLEIRANRYYKFGQFGITN